MSIHAKNIIPPGEHLREEIEERGWTQSDFSKILGRPEKVVNEIINGKRAITPETARELSRALGTSAQVWLNLESQYQLERLPGGDDSPSDPITRRSRLFEKFPVGEMQRRSWIRKCDSVHDLEAELCRYFQISSPDDDIDIPAAARTGSQPTIKFSVSQLAWMYRARSLASRLHAAKFDLERFKVGLSNLRELVVHPEQTREVPRALSELGVRFMIVEHIKGTGIDGACIWVDSDIPVIAISMRYDRIDWFWHTLMHECAHIFYNDAISLDENLDRDTEGLPDYEKRANGFAANWLIPKDEFDSFFYRAGPMFSRERIVGFAARMQVHPGIVVGQIHNRTKKYQLFRKHLERVKRIVTSSALTDGCRTERSLD